MVAWSVGCSSAPSRLLVDLTTDYCPRVPGSAPPITECRQDPFDSVRVALDRGVERTRAVQEGDAFVPPLRVASFDGLNGGLAWVTIELSRGGVVIASRRQPVLVDGPTQVTVAITVSCRAVSCPPASDPDATECVSGVCVSPECFESPGTCGPLCNTDGDCTAPFPCVRMRCIGGACLALPDASLCAPGERCLLERGCFAGVLEGDPCQDAADCGTELFCCGGQCRQPGCNDNNDCTADACGAAGCENVPSDGPCDDGIYCNGNDSCAAGACTVHPGSPCPPGRAICDEAADACLMCATDADCPGPSERAVVGCGGFTDTCDEDGTQTVAITTYHCAGGACVGDTRQEPRGCTRDRAGVGCDDGMATCSGGICRCGGSSCGLSQYCFAGECWERPRFEVYGQPSANCVDVALGPQPGLLLGYRIYGRPGAAFEKWNLHTSCPFPAWTRAETGTIPASGVFDLMLDSPVPLACDDPMQGRYQQYAVVDGIATGQAEQVIYNTNGCGAALASCGSATTVCP